MNSFESEYRPLLYGLSSNERPTRFVWLLNRILPFSFERDADIEMTRQKEIIYFIQYKHIDSERHCIYSLYRNQGTQSYLFPELKQISYFLKVYEPEGGCDREIFSLMNKPELGQLCFEIQDRQLKSASLTFLYT